MEQQNNPLEGFDWVFRPEDDEPQAALPEYYPYRHVWHPPAPNEALQPPQEDVPAQYEEIRFARTIATHRRVRAIGTRVGLGMAAVAIGVSVALFEPHSVQGNEALPPTTSSASANPGNSPTASPKPNGPPRPTIPYGIANYAVPTSSSPRATYNSSKYWMNHSSTPKSTETYSMHPSVSPSANTSPSFSPEPSSSSSEADPSQPATSTSAAPSESPSIKPTAANTSNEPSKSLTPQSTLPSQTPSAKTSGVSSTKR